MLIANFEMTNLGLTRLTLVWSLNIFC
jgi:hypothetical protein